MTVAQETYQLFTLPSAGVRTFAGRLGSLFVALLVFGLPTLVSADDAKPTGDAFADENPSLLQVLYPEAGDSSRLEILDRVAPSTSVLPAFEQIPAAESLRSELPPTSAASGDPESFVVGGDPALRAQLDHPVLPYLGGWITDGSAALPRSSALPGFYDALSLAENPAYEKTKAEPADADPEIELEEPDEGGFDVNEADKIDLMETLELDARRARYVLEYRGIFGPFTSPEDLLQVAGINDGDILDWEEQGLLNFD